MIDHHQINHSAVSGQDWDTRCCNSLMFLQEHHTYNTSATHILYIFQTDSAQKKDNNPHYFFNGKLSEMMKN